MNIAATHLAALCKARIRESSRCLVSSSLLPLLLAAESSAVGASLTPLLLSGSCWEKRRCASPASMLTSMRSSSCDQREISLESEHYTAATIPT